MAGINMPGPQQTALDRLAAGLGIANSILGISNAISDKSHKDQAYQKAAQLDLPDSQESKSAQAGYSQLGFKVDHTESANALERKYGKLADLNRAKYNQEVKKPSDTGFAISQKDLAGMVKDGVRLVPPGTNGAQTFAAIGADGKVQQVALLPPVKKAEGAAASPTDRLNSASAETKSKVGLMANALNSMTSFEQAYNSGQRPTYIDPNTPVLGNFVSDTQLTQAGRMLDEEVGRLESGGAISKDEVKSFRSMRPRPGDSPEIQAQKVASMRQFLEDRLRGFGFSPQDLAQAGYDASKLGYDKQSLALRDSLGKPQQKSNAIIPEAFAGTGKFDDHDLKARAEVNARLKKDPKDPLALEADAILRRKGL